MVVPFTDSHEKFNPNPAPDRRLFDTRTLNSPFTPKDQFFTTQHYGHPEVDPAAFRLKVSGLVNSSLALSLDDLRKMGNTELIAGFECSGNRRPIQGLIGNGRWTGVPLKTVLDKAGLKADVQEIVFFGADRGKEAVAFRGNNFDVEQQYGRSLPRARALASEPAPFLAYALNGEPLTKHQGAPLRLIVPGWYGAPNVKWLSEIVAQQDPYMGKFQTHWYRTLKGEMINGEMKWVETGITHLNLKSFVARVTKNGNAHKATVIVLNDGTPIKSVEVKVDEGPVDGREGRSGDHREVRLEAVSPDWPNAAAGEHTIVSRVTDATGKVQPTEQDLANKKTFLEDNSQHPRKIMISRNLCNSAILGDWTLEVAFRCCTVARSARAGRPRFLHLPNSSCTARWP